MARPIKNNADYFPHDADMRNDPRVKALRRKFKLEGYAIYCMVIEYLTDSDFFETKFDNLGLELMAGDFDCSPDLLKSIIQYTIELDLIQSDNSILSCKSLNNRLESVLSKRKRERSEVIDTDNTQSKVKESKANEIRQNESKGNETDEAELVIYPSFDDFWNLYGKKIDRSKCEKKWAKLTQGAREKIMEALPAYIFSTPEIEFRRHPATYLNNESWENEIIIKSNGTGTNKKQQSDKATRDSVEQHYRQKLAERGLSGTANQKSG